MLALVNVHHAQAFAMRFDRVEDLANRITLTPESLEREMVLKGDGPRHWSPRTRMVCRVFEKTTMSQICDTILMVRPYLKVVSGKARMLAGRLHLKIDGELVIDYEPIRDFWIDENPKAYDPDDPIRPRKNSYLFISGAIDSQNQADPGLGYYGIMLANGSEIKMRIADLEIREAVTLEAGLVAATYTTRQEGVEEQFGRAVGHGD